jgi:hypothetical protein
MRVEAHLDTCLDCRRLVESLGAPPDLGTVTPPAYLVERMRLGLHERLDRQEESSGLFAWLFRGGLTVPKPLAWAMVILLLVLSTDRLVQAARPERPAPTVLMDGIDHLAPLSEADRS